MEAGARPVSLDENGAGGNAAWPRIDMMPSPAPGTRLWWCVLRATPAQVRSWTDVLSAAEQTRANRFGSPLLRTRYLTGRTALRCVLANRLGLQPAQVPIVRGVRGRPRLDRHDQLDFNVSHTDDVALIGLTDSGRIGVDVERCDRTINVQGISRKFLTGNERASLAAMDADTARRTVLTLWTCKEAMSKATGDALSAPFSRIDVDLRDGRALRDGPGDYAPRDWSLHAARVPDGHVATVALWRR
jgi:4'-phosphopantetheinyl transferase